MQKNFLRISVSLFGCAVIFAVLSPLRAMHGGGEEEGLENWRRYANSPLPRDPDQQTVRDELRRIKDGLQYLVDKKHIFTQSERDQTAAILVARAAAFPDEPAQAPNEPR